MTTYVFEPLMQDGKQVVRPVNPGEWYEYENKISPWMLDHPSYTEFNVFTLKRIDSGAIHGLREAYSTVKPWVDSIEAQSSNGLNLLERHMWIAISSFIKELDKEEKR